MRSCSLLFGRERAKLGSIHDEEVIDEVEAVAKSKRCCACSSPTVLARAPNIAAYAVRRALMRRIE